MNVSRLHRAGEPGVTGIDRFEAAYARQAVESQVFSARLVTAHAGGAWREIGVASIGDVIAQEALRAPADAAAYAEISAFLHAAPSGVTRGACVQRVRFAKPAALPGTRLRLFSVAKAFAGRQLNLSALKNAIHLQASHTLLASPDALAALARHNIASVHYLHDTIPLDFPEYCRPGADVTHRARITTLQRLAATILVSSAHVAARLRSVFEQMGGLSPPVRIVPPGLAEAFKSPRPQRKSPAPYFIAIGTIEPRKNHLLLLNVWRRMAQTMASEKMPKLVIAGWRGWENEAIVDYFNRCEALRGHVLEIEGLPDEALADLTASACGVLAPSFAEGYGLSLAEAAALGVPVIASDIGAHREVWAALGGGAIRWLDPSDGPGWLQAVADYCAAPDTDRRALAQTPTRTLSWQDHWRAIEAILLETLASRA